MVRNSTARRRSDAGRRQAANLKNKAVLASVGSYCRWRLELGPRLWNLNFFEA